MQKANTTIITTNGKVAKSEVCRVAGINGYRLRVMLKGQAAYKTLTIPQAKNILQTLLGAKRDFKFILIGFYNSKIEALEIPITNGVVLKANFCALTGFSKAGLLSLLRQKEKPITKNTFFTVAEAAEIIDYLEIDHAVNFK
jgi:hypothetical protein